MEKVQPKLAMHIRIPSSKRTLLLDWIVPAVLVASLFGNVALSRRVRILQTTLDQTGTLAVGDTAPEPTLRTVEGRQVKLDYRSSPKGTLIYYFDPHCGWCRRNSPNFREAEAAAVRQGYRVVSYTTSLLGLDNYQVSAAHAAPVLTDDDTNVRTALRLRGTPQTLVVDRSGRVLKNWEGAYTGPTAREIEAFFRVHLPGLLK